MNRTLLLLNALALVALIGLVLQPQASTVSSMPRAPAMAAKLAVFGDPATTATVSQQKNGLPVMAVGERLSF
ncbi:hypothetical protein [Pseudomonas sp. DG56-2]|uniref:hypothetical protein n=1 Tax=Pseudomonas sp. DG56-2 TaxID=2320270 RepID=UPI0010A6407C|nr:hypothetical protein [Pseudomonas sp. DG56-2]